MFVALAASNELASYMQRNNVNPLKNLVVPFAQVSAFLLLCNSNKTTIIIMMPAGNNLS